MITKCPTERKCDVCGRLYIAKRKNSKYCNIVCAQRMWNKRHAEKYHLRVEVDQRRCEQCDQLFWPSDQTPLTQRFCSKLCRERSWRKHNREHYTARRKAERERLRDWYRAYNTGYKNDTRFSGNKFKVLERDNYTCQNCNYELVENPTKAQELIIHHQDWSGKLPKPNNDVDNLITLCRACHIRIHTHQVTRNL